MPSQEVAEQYLAVRRSLIRGGYDMEEYFAPTVVKLSKTVDFWRWILSQPHCPLQPVRAAAVPQLLRRDAQYACRQVDKGAFKRYTYTVQ